MLYHNELFIAAVAARPADSRCDILRSHRLLVHLCLFEEGGGYGDSGNVQWGGVNVVLCRQTGKTADRCADADTKRVYVGK